jgi:hypothetical protein
MEREVEEGKERKEGEEKEKVERIGAEEENEREEICDG